MNVERIFKQIPMFEKLEMDVVLFESKYPVLFTCKVDRDVYLFICCLVKAELVEWIGTKTNYGTLVQLLENDITIRDAFLNVTDEKVIIDYDGVDVHCHPIKKDAIPWAVLPTAGEYMDADEGEYEEEIAIFKARSRTLEFKIEPRTNKYYLFSYQGASMTLPDVCFNLELGFENELKYGIKRILDRRIAYA